MVVGGRNGYSPRSKSTTSRLSTGRIAHCGECGTWALVSPKSIKKETLTLLGLLVTQIVFVLPRYALDSSPTVDPTSKSISRLLIRSKKSAIKVDTCSWWLGYLVECPIINAQGSCFLWTGAPQPFPRQGQDMEQFGGWNIPNSFNSFLSSTNFLIDVSWKGHLLNPAPV